MSRWMALLMVFFGAPAHAEGPADEAVAVYWNQPDGLRQELVVAVPVGSEHPVFLTFDPNRPAASREHPKDYRVEPGTYDLKDRGELRTARAEFGGTSADHNLDHEGFAGSGQIIITRLAPRVSGTFALDFPVGGKVERAFDARLCSFDLARPSELQPLAAVIPGDKGLGFRVAFQTDEGCRIYLGYNTVPDLRFASGLVFGKLTPIGSLSLGRLAGSERCPALPGTFTTEVESTSFTVTEVGPDTLTGHYDVSAVLPTGKLSRWSGDVRLPLCSLIAMDAPKPALRPKPPEKGPCAPAQVAADQARFKKLYRAKRWQEAFDALSGLKDRCFALLGSAEEQVWLASDLAITAHKLGNDALCRALAADAPRLPEGSKAGEALGFNAALCGAGCNIYGDPGCLEGRQARKADLAYPEPRYARPRCGIPGAKNAIAVAARAAGVRQACVALIPSHVEELDEKSRIESGVDVRVLCPKLRVIEQLAGGALHEGVIDFGKEENGPLVADPSTCCNVESLSVVEQDGRTLVRVKGGGRDCYGGTASTDVDEIFTWDGRVLAPHHDNDFRWH